MSRHRASSRPASLRGGLPYGWWRSNQFWENAIAYGSLGAVAVLLSVIVLAWWGLI